MKRELPGMIALAERLLASDTPGTLAILFSARGSTYRTLGSMMVSLPGIRAGGVSGGCLEEYVARAGERANGNTRYRPAGSLWPGGTRTRWIPLRGFTGSFQLLLFQAFPNAICG